MMKLQHVLLGALIALVGTTASAATADPVGRNNYPYLLNKIDHYAYAVDISGSMMMTMPGTGMQKVVLAKQVLGNIDARVPTLPYNTSVFTVAPAATVAPQSSWNRMGIVSTLSDLPVDLPIFGRLTDLGGDLARLAGQFPTYRGALVLVTDGGDNLGNSPVDAARQLAASGVLLHIISFADTPEGKANIAGMAAANPNTVCVNGMDLIMSPTAVDAFVKAVYYEESVHTVIDTVYFATGSYELDGAARATLDNMAAIIMNVPRGVRTVIVEGFTDSVGGYGPNNSALSFNRAFAVRDYLVSKGVSADKIYTKGNNVSHKFTNTSNDGRQHNRRADIIIN